MNGVNKVILIGNLGKDPEVMNFDNGNKKVSFSLATNESYKGKDGSKQSKTEWHNIALWRKGLADVAEKYLKKGDSVYIEGKIHTSQYEKDGIKRYSTEIYGDNLTMLGSKNDSSNYNKPPTQAAAHEEPDISSPVDDDLPF